MKTNMTAAENFLTCILECGESDLRLLEDVEYAWEDVMDQMDFPDYHKFNDVIRAVISLGIIDIKEWIENRLEEESISHEERTILMSLNPDQDIEAFCNYSSSEVYFTRFSKQYHAYCQDILDVFKRKTGFQING